MTSQVSDQHGPAVPAYIFRGHVSAVHTLHFFASNAFLASADSNGWLLVWSLASRRAVSVWKAHDGGILGVKSWGRDRLITHGRDHKLRVWRLQEEDHAVVDLKLPVDGAEANTCKQPWLLHSLDMSALNFCAFATCYWQPIGVSPGNGQLDSVGATGTEDHDAAVLKNMQPVLIAAPNGLDSGGIDFFQLPSERRVSKLPADRVSKTGMVMTVSLFYSESKQLTVVSGYEDGHTMVHVRQDSSGLDDEWKWQKVLTCKPHSQPLLSLDVSQSGNFYVTSSADAIIAKFEIPTASLIVNAETQAAKVSNTKHAGQQGLCMRTDGKIFATAGWDARIRVYSAKTLKELAVLKWHKSGCYAVAFAEVDPSPELDVAGNSSNEATKSGEAVSALDIIKQKRIVKAQSTHWLAAGGKDGKISLWDIY